MLFKQMMLSGKDCYLLTKHSGTSLRYVQLCACACVYPTLAIHLCHLRFGVTFIVLLEKTRLNITPEH